MKTFNNSSDVFATRIPMVTFIFLGLAPLAIVWYGAFIFNFNNADNLFLYIIQIGADSIAMMVLLGLWITILIDVIVENHHRVHKNQDVSFLKNEHPTIDIFITVYGEPIEIIQETVQAATSMEYNNKKVIILDDGKSDEVRYLAKKLHVYYYRRRNNSHAKAGNVNNALRFSKSDFFVILDADHVPKKKFITTLLPFMANKEIAMVQSPQHFSNMHDFIASGTAQAQEVFYKYVCPAKNISNSAFSVGTNVIFRRSAIDEIGGIVLNNSEDIWTTFLLHKNKWKTIFVNKVLAVGIAPTTIISFFKQQRRWAIGGLDMLINENPLYTKELDIDQRIQYFISSTFFLVGIPIIVYIVMPLIYLLTGQKPLVIEDGVLWLIHYLPYFILYFTLTWLLLGQKMLISTMSTALASFYPYLMALFAVFFSTEQEWVATTSSKSNVDPIMRWIWPHVFLLILSILSLIVGWYNPIEFWATLFNSLWVSLNIFLLIMFLSKSQMK